MSKPWPEINIVQRRAALFAVALTFALEISAPTPALADNSFQCQAGPNQAIVDSCGARWEAANIRAHVSASDYGGSSAACLNETATLLEGLASKWLSDNKSNAFTGQWPCGAEPSVAKANDGALEQACPRGIWSYENKGASGCNGASPLVTRPAQQNSVAQPSAATPQEPCDSAFRQVLDRGFAAKIRVVIFSGEISRYSTAKAPGIGLIPVSNGAVIAATIASGSADIGLGTASSVDVAVQRGIPFTVLGPAASADGHDRVWFSLSQWAHANTAVGQQFVAYMRAAAACS
jgi:hypothetical protein